MVKGLSLRSNKRTKVVSWILPLYAAVFLCYASFGTHENRQIRKIRELPNLEDHRHLWGNDAGLEGAEVSQQQQRHLLSVRQNCTPAAIEEFPPDFFSQAERARGGLIIHFLISIYLFYALAIICDDYFVPSLECLCDRLDLPTDVAGATFMAMGTSAPELFTSVIGQYKGLTNGAFITEGDIGVGTIVGSAVFNILAVLSVCGLLAGIVVPLDWWPLTRDSFAYVITVISLILIITDQHIRWWEGAIMLLLYCLYIVMMVFNRQLEKLTTRALAKCGLLPKHQQQQHLVESLASTEDSPLLADAKETSLSKANGHDSNGDNNGYSVSIKDDDDSDDDADDVVSVWSMPYHGTWSQISWVLMWPANLLFHVTIPNCRKKSWRGWYMGTFTMSIVYIGSLSYAVAWMVTVIGYTIGVPDTVMGLTFLAAGTSVPEAISSVLVCRQGHGNMAVSNILGSNIFDILFCLGLPWLIKAACFSSNHTVVINSAGIEYSTISLLSTVVFLFAVVVLNKWRLDKRLGYSCLAMYLLFLVFSNLFELNVFGTVNLPSCMSHK